MSLYNPLWKKRLILLPLALFFLLTQSLLAAPVNEKIAKKVATHFALSISPLRSNTDLTLVFTGVDKDNGVLRSDQEPLLYVYNVGLDDGFVMVSGDDNAYPILGYADKGSFQTEGIPENLSYWLEFYQKEISYIKESNGVCLETKQKWDHLLAGASIESISGNVLPTAKWNQSEPYNDQCPLDSLGKLSVTGCVATAMGIVMKYHNWPEKGKGSNEYKFSGDSIPVSESFEIAYDWGNMLDTYILKDRIPLWNDTQAEAVSTLIYHCGVAVNMNYSSSASGAYTFNAMKALINNFGYDNGMYIAYRDLYSTPVWNEMIRKELDENLPVIYSGVKEDESAHMFIIDGYATSNDYFHVNWGWNGSADGYYLLSSLEPTWIGIGGGKEGEGFSYDQEAIIGVKKAEEGSEANYEFYFLQPDEPGPWGIYTDKDIVWNEPFRFYFTYIYDRGHRDFNGAFAVLLFDKNDNLKEMVDGFVTDLPGGYVLYEPEGETLVVTGDVEEGDYLQMYYSTDFKLWSPIKGENRATTQLSVLPTSPTGNLSINRKENVTVYPTRVSTDVTIRTNENDQIQRILLYDLSGHLKQEEYVYGERYQMTFSLSGQHPGIYILSVQTSKGESKHKIIKE